MGPMEPRRPDGTRWQLVPTALKSRRFGSLRRMASHPPATRGGFVCRKSDIEPMVPISSSRARSVTESAAGPRPIQRRAMCEKCNEFDSKIAHYRRIAIHMTDQQTLDGIAGLIKRMMVEKAAIRCEPAKK